MSLPYDDADDGPATEPVALPEPLPTLVRVSTAFSQKRSAKGRLNAPGFGPRGLSTTGSPLRRRRR